MENLKSKLLAVLKEAARAAVSAFLAALGLVASVSASGCAVVVPSDDARSVAVTGAIPLSLQFNSEKN